MAGGATAGADTRFDGRGGNSARGSLTLFGFPFIDRLMASCLERLVPVTPRGRVSGSALWHSMPSVRLTAALPAHYSTALSTLLDYLQPARLPRHAAALTLRPDSTVANSNGSRTLSDQVVSPNSGEQPRDNPADIRRWPRENGYSVGVRGRIHSIVIAA